MTGGTVEDLMAEIARLAPVKKHNLGRDMVNGSRTLTLIAARMVLANLKSCPDITPAADSLPGSPAPQSQQAALPPISAFRNVPEGYYATPSADSSDVIDYWKAEKGKKGTKWEDTTFLRRVLGGISADDRKLRTVRLENIQQRIGLRKITEFGLKDSQVLFADTLRRCVDCSSPLTDPVSRANRRGRVCQDNFTSKH